MNDLLRAAPRPSMVRALSEYNPFYLLSALCMLAGIFALNDSLDFDPLPAPRLLGLILTLNLYEFLLIGIGIFLARRGLMRDATMLFVLEAFFLADAGFLNAEAFTQDFALGLALNLFLFVLAAGKLVMIFLGLRLPLGDTRLVLVLAQMLILLALPGFLKQLSEANGGRVTPLAIYAAWWVVGLVPILYILLMRQSHLQAHRGIIGAFIVLPMISILAHLCTSNWVYSVRWQFANLSPLVLALAAAIGASDWHVRHLTARMRTHLLLPLLAIFMAWPDHPRLDFWMDDIAMSPMRLTLIGAAMVYFYGLWLHRHAWFGIFGMLCLGMTGVGHSPEMMRYNTVSLLDRVLEFIRSLFPRTLTQWGIISVVSSFLLLGLGLVMSLLRLPVRQERRRMEVPEEVNVN